MHCITYVAGKLGKALFTNRNISFLNLFSTVKRSKYIGIVMSCAKKIYKLIEVDQHQYFDGHVQVECFF